MAIDFSTMDGYEFEVFMTGLFRRLGFEVETTAYSNDGGIDLIAVYNEPIFSGKYIIQCKNWIGSVGQPEVRDLYGVVTDQRANKGILITPSDYTQQAIDFARGKNIELINGQTLRRILETYYGQDSNVIVDTTVSETEIYRNDRYSYWEKAIAEEPNNVANYLKMIEFLREYLIEQDQEACTVGLIKEVISWTDKLINRCFKKSSKKLDRIEASLFKVEMMIILGQLAEATEELLKCDKFWIEDGYNGYKVLDGRINIEYNTDCIMTWNLYVAYRHIGYGRGCALLTSKYLGGKLFRGWFEDNDYTDQKMKDLFIHPSPYLISRTASQSEQSKHLELGDFWPEHIKNPAFFFEKFYKKSREEYAREINRIFELRGIR